MVSQYAVISATTWWLFHVSAISFGVRFPFVARRWKTKEKYIHLFFLILGRCKSLTYLWTQLNIACHFPGLLIPLLSVIVPLTGEGPGYTFFIFPPIHCRSNDSDLAFYSVVLILDVMLILGVPQLIVVVWTLHKVWSYNTNMKTTCTYKGKYSEV